MSTSRLLEALARLEKEGYTVLNGIAYRNVFGAPAPCAILRSPRGTEEVATLTTASTDSPILGIYPRSMTNI